MTGGLETQESGRILIIGSGFAGLAAAIEAAEAGPRFWSWKR